MADLKPDSKSDSRSNLKPDRKAETGKDGRDSYSEPEHVINVGDISLHLYSREGDFGLMYNGKVLRNYIDPNTGEMKSTYYLGDRDFVDAINAFSEGVRYIQDRKMNYNLKRATSENYTSRSRSDQKKGQSTQPPAAPETGQSSPASIPPVADKLESKKGK